MPHKITITIRIIAYILTTLFLIGVIWFGLSYKNNQINHLQAEVNILFNFKLNEPGLKEQIANLKADKKQLQQQLNNLNIHYTADEKYIEVLESRYLKTKSYANVAEFILIKQGIEFRQVD